MKLEFHYSYIIIALGFVLTGYFSNLIVFTSIIIIHEIGHFIVAKLNNLKVTKIVIYPYGGLLKMNNLLNTPINKELTVAISGIIFQEIYFMLIIVLYKNNIIREYIFNLFSMYNKNILIFNILPLHPLDGSKILNLLLSKIIPYRIANILNVIISIITIIIIFILNYYKFNYTTIIIITIIIDNIIKYLKDLKYLFNKFLLERYLYRLKYNKTIKISKIKNFYKDKNHIIKENFNYITEKQALKCRFQIKK